MRRGKSLQIAAIFILSLLFVFEAPVIPVEGSQTFASACHRPPTIYLNGNYTDWQSVGYHFLGIQLAVLASQCINLWSALI
jgi:hypothetical protein